MKKLLYCAAALATLLFAGSCQKEKLEPEQTTDGKVTFTVELPTGIQTKADIGDGTNVDQLIYEVWLTENEAQKDLTTGATKLYKVDNVALTLDSDGVRKATLELDLMNDQNFTVLFWAQVNGTGAYKTDELTAVTYAKDLDKYSSNDESLAAFYGSAYVKDCKHIDTDGKPTDPKVTLRRPFAQLNLGTLNTTTQYTVAVEKSDVKITNVPTVFNVSTKEVSVPQVISFQKANVPTNPTDITVQNKDYDYVAMNYVFAGDNAEVEYNIYTKVGGTVDAVVNNVVKNVPLKENHRTNIIGNLLTSKVDYQIVVDADFNTPDIDLESVTDGLVQVNPDLNATAPYKKMYEISSANGFAYAMMEIVDNMEARESAEFYLISSIDMKGINYVPPTVKTGVDVLLATGAAPMTRAASEITISGLDSPVFEKVANGAVVTFSDIVVEEHESDAALVGEVEDGAEVMIYNCEASDSADEEVDLIGTGADNVVDLESGVSTLEQLQAALRTNATEIEVLSTIEIKGSETVVLDLNGKTITGVDNTNKNYSIIDNRGNLTVKNGTMKLSATVESGWNRASSVISNNPGGNLTVESDAVIEHLGGTSMAYGIDNLTNGKGTSAITTINGATVKSKYIAVRQFLNGVDATNELYVNSGRLDGKYTIFFQDPSENANTGKLVVAEAAELYSSVYLGVTEGSTEWPVSVSIADSALKNGAKVVSANVPSGYDVINDNGTWTVVKYSSFSELVTKVIDGNGTYEGNGETYMIIPASGDARLTTADAAVPNRLQKYSDPEVYYAQYQRFTDLADINISNVTITFVPAAITVIDAWNTAGATTTNENINGEIQLMNSGKVTLTNCVFNTVSVSPINTTELTVTGCEFNDLKAYALKDINASVVVINNNEFNNCNGGFWFNAAPKKITATENIFSVGRRGAIQFSTSGDYTDTSIEISSNKVEGALLWQLNQTLSYEQYNAIINNNTYTKAYVDGSVIPAEK